MRRSVAIVQVFRAGFFDLLIKSSALSWHLSDKPAVFVPGDLVLCENFTVNRNTKNGKQTFHTMEAMQKIEINIKSFWNYKENSRNR